jgi:hypothetical protein
MLLDVLKEDCGRWLGAPRSRLVTHEEMPIPRYAPGSRGEYS